jgi:pimeloyl-ACP methyl ester carboxylesterase
MEPGSTDDGRLYYTERGAGDAVVLVHGGLSDGRTWQAQLEALSTSHRVIAYTRRDHHVGRAQAEAPDQMSKDIQDLAALAGKLGLGPVHLVGHSWGAFVCLWLSIRRPDLVRSLVLAEPPFLPLFVSSPPKPQELIRMFAISPATAMTVLRFGMRGFATPTSVVKRDGALMFARSPMGMPVGQALDAPPKSKSKSKAKRPEVRDNLEALRSEFLANNFGPLSDELLEQVRVPVLLLTGEDSPAFLTRLIDRLEQLLPDSRRVTIEGASHFMHEDNPEAFNREVLEFWARQPSAQPRARGDRVRARSAARELAGPTPQLVRTRRGPKTAAPAARKGPAATPATMLRSTRGPSGPL